GECVGEYEKKSGFGLLFVIELDCLRTPLCVPTCGLPEELEFGFVDWITDNNDDDPTQLQLC
ncbi:hypothetical protein AAFF_G00206420, partial [Aldrovandia affinis]